MNLLRAEPATAFELPWATRSTLHAPWRPMALARFAVVDAVALALILVSAYQAGQQDDVQEAITWLVVTGVGLVVSGLGAFLWVSNARLAVAGRRDRLDEAIAACMAELRPAIDTGPHGAPATLVHAPRTQRFHQSTCALVAARKATPGTRATFEKRRLVPCEVCQP